MALCVEATHWSLPNGPFAGAWDGGQFLGQAAPEFNLPDGYVSFGYGTSSFSAAQQLSIEEYRDWEATICIVESKWHLWLKVGY